MPTAHRLRPIALVVLASISLVVGLVALVQTSGPPANASGPPASPATPVLAPAPSPSGSLGPPPPFEASIDRLTEQQQKWMDGENWASYCPIRFADLRLLTVTYENFEGDPLEGRVIVNRNVATKMVGVFEELYDAGFQIEHLDTIELYPPKQRPDKLRNVSAAYNCRPIKGTSTWSQHTYGLAIDLNPVQNPYVNGSDVIPNVGKPYVNRKNERPGMILAKGPVVRAFRDIGWEWGGNWNSVKDYMHFSKTGG